MENCRQVRWRMCKWLRQWSCCIFLVAALSDNIGAMTYEQSILNIADRLVADQVAHGPSAGSWPGETVFTGSIVPGLVRAFLITGDTNYILAAEAGGDYIIGSAGGNFYADEAYALTRLSMASDDPDNNSWRTAVSNFYQAVKNSGGGTTGYINYYLSGDPSDAVFYMAHHTLAAYHVEAADISIWRSRLIDYLAAIRDGYCAYPVGSLGLAIWALAQTGPMDATFVAPSASSTSYWYQVTLADLPALLLGHQVLSAGAYPGSFYWRFDHGYDSNPYNSGYTEDAVFSVLGLTASVKNVTGLSSPADYYAAIGSAQDVLAYGVDADGLVYNHIWNGGVNYYVYAGETLSDMPLLGDIDRDDEVGITDISVFRGQWLQSGCGEYDFCQGADFDHSGTVNLADFAFLSHHWLEIID